MLHTSFSVEIVSLDLVSEMDVLLISQVIEALHQLLLLAFGVQALPIP